MDYDKAKAIKAKTVTILNLLKDIQELAEHNKEIHAIMNNTSALLQINLLEEHVFTQYPELDDLDVLTDEEVQQLHLTTEEVRKVEDQVYAKTGAQRKKVARIIGECLLERDNLKLPKVNNLYYAHVIRQLVSQGKLEGFGNLNRIRYSEVSRIK